MPICAVSQGDVQFQSTERLYGGINKFHHGSSLNEREKE